MTYIFKRKYLYFIIIMFLINGCDAALVMHTSDPGQKINNAYEMMYPNGRFIPAKRFIEEAEKIYQEEGNKPGLAEAYLAFGNLYKHGPVGKLQNKYKDYDLSRQYLERAYNLYSELGDDMGRAKCLLVISQTLNDDTIKQCEYLKKSREIYYEGKKKNPSAELQMRIKSDFPAFINDVIQESGCK